MADSLPLPYWSEFVERKSIIWKFYWIKSSVLSPVFSCCRYDWQLSISSRRESSDYADIYLHVRVNSEIKINLISIKLIVLDKTQNILFECKKTFRKVVSSAQQLTFDGVTAASLLRANPLTVQFSISAMDRKPADLLTEVGGNVLKAKKERLPTLTDSLNLLSSDFEELYNNHRYSDVTLKLAEGEFQAHKSVLSARSKVFAAMFEHDMKENRLSSVDLVQMEVETVQDMLRYIYSGKVRELSSEEALNLYIAADRYDMQELKTFCREVVITEIFTSNVCDIAEVAHLHDDEILIGKLKSFLSENGKEVVKTEKWQEIRTKNQALGAKMFEWAFSE